MEKGCEDPGESEGRPGGGGELAVRDTEVAEGQRRSPRGGLRRLGAGRREPEKQLPPFLLTAAAGEGQRS